MREIGVKTVVGKATNQQNPIWRLIDWLSDFSAALAGLMMLGVAFINVYEIIARYVFNRPTEWVLEFSIYATIWFGFLAAAYALKNESHIRVDVLTNKLRGESQQIFIFISNLFLMVYVLVLVYFGTMMALKSFQTGQVTPDVLATPVWKLHVAVPLGSLLLALQLIRILRDQGKELSLSRHKLTIRKFLPSLMFIGLIVLSIVIMSWNQIVGSILLLAIVLFGGVPVFAALGLTGSVVFWLLLGGGKALLQVPFISYASLNDFLILAIPLFILGGELLRVGGTADELFDLCYKFVGHFPGGLAVTAIFASSIFAAISGSSVATAATIGMIAIPAMLEHGYDRKLAFGVVAVAGTLGILIPPSNAMILYSSITNESTGALFMAGVVPGILLALILSLFVIVVSFRKERKRIAPFSWRERFVSTKKGIWAILAPVIILGGIYIGVFTPTEAAAVLVVYSIFLNLFRRRITRKNMSTVLSESTKTGVMILSIIGGAMILGSVFTQLQVPQLLSNWVISTNIPAWIVLVMVMLLMLILGTMLETVSIILITIPILYPTLINLGFNGLWFGILLVINMELALITPPVGLNLYVVRGLVKDSTMGEIWQSIIPFIILLTLFLILIALIPAITLWLPGTMGW